MLELTPLENTLVGSEMAGGMSFEQKKRVSIGMLMSLLYIYMYKMCLYLYINIYCVRIYGGISFEQKKRVSIGIEFLVIIHVFIALTYTVSYMHISLCVNIVFNFACITNTS
jgi:hypothetical protein